MPVSLCTRGDDQQPCGDGAYSSRPRAGAVPRAGVHVSGREGRLTSPRPGSTLWRCLVSCSSGKCDYQVGALPSLHGPDGATLSKDEEHVFVPRNKCLLVCRSLGALCFRWEGLQGAAGGVADTPCGHRAGCQRASVHRCGTEGAPRSWGPFCSRVLLPREQRGAHGQQVWEVGVTGTCSRHL